MNATKACLEQVTLAEQAHDRGDPLTALTHADQALRLASDAEHRGYGYLLRAMSLAMMGRLEDSVEPLREILREEPSDIAGYYLASVLANLGRIDEAETLFKRNLEIPLGNGNTTNTSCIRFSPPLDLDEQALPFRREVRLDFDVPESCRSVYFVCCDSRYFRLFREALLTSIDEFAPEGCSLHLHLINPMPGDLEWSPDAATDVTLTSEEVDFPALNAAERRTYYSCVRYLVLPELLKRYRTPMLVADMDQVLVSAAQPAFDLLHSADIALLRFEGSRFNLLSMFSATVSLFSPSNDGIQFAERLRRYVLGRMSTAQCFLWHLDQAALAVTFLSEERARPAFIDPDMMCSTGDGSRDYPEGTIFWSITYSIPNNATKLDARDDERPLISIVVPVYNGANYMREAIDSALSQSYERLEVIVVNDGSTDDGETDRIARSYGDRIRYVHKENGGVASALNRGIAEMAGDVFCWLSHDDLHFENKTSIQVKRWEADGRPDQIYFSNYRLIDEHGSTITDVALDHPVLTQKPVYALLRGSIHGCSLFVPRALFDKYGTFDESLPTTQDFDLWRRMIRQVPFVHMDEVLIGSRWHDEQGSKTMEHQSESNELWSNLLRMLTPAEQTKLEGSAFRFQSEMAGFLEQNGLQTACEDAGRLAKDAMSNTLVSVVIPSYNRAEKLISAIDSVRGQSHPTVEIVVVDDGSAMAPEDLRAILERRVPGVRFFRQENSGPGCARNHGCRVAKGQYIAFLDSDDLFLVDKVARQLEAMELLGVAVSHTPYWNYDETNDEISLSSASVEALGRFPEMIENCVVATPTVMVRRSDWLDRFAFPEDVRIGEDVLTWLNIASQGLLTGIDDPLTVVRRGADATANVSQDQTVGVRNILAGISRDPYLARFSEQTAALEAKLNA